ncbi:MAG: hypothetical protein ACK55I_03615, partial [bacterium]
PQVVRGWGAAGGGVGQGWGMGWREAFQRARLPAQAGNRLEGSGGPLQQGVEPDGTQLVDRASQVRQLIARGGVPFEAKARRQHHPIAPGPQSVKESLIISRAKAAGA